VGRTYFTGQHEAMAALRAMAAKAEAETPGTINGILLKVATQQRTLLNLGSHPPGTRTGSVPGSPPWRISGHLTDSVTVRRARLTGLGRWEGQVGPTAVYGRVQELGGGPWNLPARPSLRPAWDLVRPTVSQQFRAAWG
jgi:hypothetical protein